MEFVAYICNSHATDEILLIGEEMDAKIHETSELSCCENFAYFGFTILWPSISSMRCGTTNAPNRISFKINATNY